MTFLTKAQSALPRSGNSNCSTPTRTSAKSTCRSSTSSACPAKRCALRFGKRSRSASRDFGPSLARHWPGGSAIPPLQSLIATGTKLWLDSVDPDVVRRNSEWGTTGATSNPIIVTEIIKSGRFDAEIAALVRDGLDDEAISWRLTDFL